MPEEDEEVEEGATKTGNLKPLPNQSPRNSAETVTSYKV
jgi:hypothetical protein